LANFDSYIICTSPRSGSTLLCKLLENTGVAGVPESYFHKPSVPSWAAGVGLPTLSEGQNVQRILDAVMDIGRGQTGIFGLRLQHHSFAFLMQELRQLHPQEATDVACLARAFGRARFIHLTREDKLEQAVSAIKAEQTGLWHQAPDGREIERLSPPNTAAYDSDAMAMKVAEFTMADASWTAWFEAQQIAPLHLSYATLASDPRGALAYVLDDLGCDSSGAQQASLPTAKLADDQSREWVQRFRVEQS
jgi:LPS sulfotransferase NodH